METPTLKRTPLYEAHVAAGAKLVPFAGWEMPIQYGDGIRSEHMAVRTRCGVFDVSHMGEVQISGPDAEAFLQHVFSNDVSKIPVGGAQYSMLCNEDGGLLDDLFTYRLAPERFLTVTNASNHENDSPGSPTTPTATTSRCRTSPTTTRCSPSRARSRASSCRRSPTARCPAACRRRRGSCSAARRSSAAPATRARRASSCCSPRRTRRSIWEELLRRGAVPCGLATRDTLRMEVCYPLYGNDLVPERNPIEAALGWVCKEDTGFIGSDAVRRAREDGTAEKLVAFKITGPGIARQGNPVVGGGEVTSGTMSPSLGIGIGMAYVPTERAKVGEEFEIDVRGKRRSAVVASKPLYTKETDG